LECREVRERKEQLERELEAAQLKINELCGQSKTLEREQKELRGTCNIKEEKLRSFREKVERAVNYNSEEHQISTSAIEENSKMISFT
jgi:chromosome segregation ATPase